MSGGRSNRLCERSSSWIRGKNGKGGQIMRSQLVFVVGLLALLLQPQPSMAQQAPLPQHDPVSVKLRLEIELRGVLSVTEKSATLTNKETIWEWVEVPEYRDPTGYHAPTPGGMTLRSRQVDKVWVLELD